MPYLVLSIDAPTLSAYDPDNPTQATEELNLQLHNILQDMEDSSWKLNDGVISAGHWTTFGTWLVAQLGVVFDYAAQAIADHRADDPISIIRPTASAIPAHTYVSYYPSINTFMMKFLADCYKMMFMIYYMWKTEEDPLLLKEKLQELLVAWPLQDIAIDLNDETGTQLKVYPQWKHLET